MEPAWPVTCLLPWEPRPQCMALVAGWTRRGLICALSCTALPPQPQDWRWGSDSVRFHRELAAGVETMQALCGNLSC